MAKERTVKTIAGIGTLLVILAAAVYIGRLWTRQGDSATAPLAVQSGSTLRIVSMAPNLTEILFAMGLGDKVIAVSSDSDYPPAADKLPKTGTFWQPDLEAVVALRPTLVVTLGFQQQAQMADKLRSLHIPALTVHIESIEGLMEAIGSIGRATGREAQAHSLLDSMQSRMAQLNNQCAGRSKPRVLWVIQRSPLRVAGVTTFINEYLTRLGAVNAVGPTLHQYPPIDAEGVLAARPDVLIEPVDDLSDLPRQLEEARQFYSRYDSVPAVVNNRIALIDANLVSRLGPRLPEGLRQIAAVLWPEAAPPETRP